MSLIASGLCAASSTLPFDGAVVVSTEAARPPTTWKVMYNLEQRAFHAFHGPAQPWDQLVAVSTSFDAAALVLEGLHYEQLNRGTTL